MAGAAGLMAEVSWKVLERRARTKRSGLAGWGATPSPAPWVVLLLKRLGREAGAAPAMELCWRVPPGKAGGGPGLPPADSHTFRNWTVTPTLLRVCFPLERWQ